MLNWFLQAVLYFTGEALEDEVRHSLLNIFCPVSSLYKHNISPLTCIFHIFEYHSFFLLGFLRTKRETGYTFISVFVSSFLGVPDNVTGILWLHTLYFMMSDFRKTAFWSIFVFAHCCSYFSAFTFNKKGIGYFWFLSLKMSPGFYTTSISCTLLQLTLHLFKVLRVSPTPFSLIAFLCKNNSTVCYCY